MLLKVKPLLVALISVNMITAAHADLTINGAKARIAWGDGDSLEKARAIMYNNNNTTNQTNSATYNSYPQQYQSYDGYGSDRLPISTRSRGVLVMDLVTDQPVYEKNAEIARPIASITKIMTAMVVLDAGQDMKEEIKLAPIDFIGPKKASSRLKAGDRMNRAEMLLMTLMKSENPAAKSLARHYPGGYSAFMAAMNRKAQDLGMYSSFFGDPTGLDKRNVASPMDLVRMMKAAREYDVIRRFSTTTNYDFFVANYSVGNRIYEAKNTSKLVRAGSYPISMSKTGYIREAGRCVVMETRVNNRPALVVILGAPSSANRWNDAETILNSLYMRRI